MATNGDGIAPVRLGSWPTPLEPAPRLALAIGLGAEDLRVKRDDLTGLGGGGNKVRKLEWICGDAISRGVDTLVTGGAGQSNHARLTATAGARLGLKVVLVLTGESESRRIGNVALDGLLGATVEWAGGVPHEDLELLAQGVIGELRRQGAHPMLIPYGGSSVLGARGYVSAGRELLAQLPDLTVVVTAVGSGGTMAGLVHSLGPQRVLGVDCGAVQQPAMAVAELVAGLSGTSPAPGQLQILTDQVGSGYGELAEPVMSALELAARTEGLLLDPIYTGRALAGLISAVAEGRIQRGDKVVLLHSGGLPGFFGHPATMARSAAGLVDFSNHVQSDPSA